MTVVSLQDLRAEALARLARAEPGVPLGEATEALIAFALCVSVTALDMAGARDQAQRAMSAGVSPAQLHEALFLVSGLGVHSLFGGSRLIAELARPPGGADAPLDETRQAIWDKRIGTDRYWASLERETPGFLKSLLRLSPDGFEAFVDYCAVPWTSGLLAPLTKELIAMAVDATPTHRFLPGMRLHLDNALRLGAGRIAILQALDLAAAAPAHSGIG